MRALSTEAGLAGSRFLSRTRWEGQGRRSQARTGATVSGPTAHARDPGSTLTNVYHCGGAPGFFREEKGFRMQVTGLQASGARGNLAPDAPEHGFH
jgi:hypothetical protein